VDREAPALGELLADERVVKVFHAARQDVEIFLLKFGAVPKPLFDSQVAAMVAGFGDQVSYDGLCRALERAFALSNPSSASASATVSASATTYATAVGVGGADGRVVARGRVGLKWHQLPQPLASAVEAAFARRWAGTDNRSAAAAASASAAAAAAASAASVAAGPGAELARWLSGLAKMGCRHAEMAAPTRLARANPQHHRQPRKSLSSMGLSLATPP
jgi:hypothetical protein